jgi:hypothetical protein
MQFTARVFTLAKDPQHPDEFQDACRIDPAAGVAAVADGVASAIFSGQWAELLVAAAVADMPDPDDQPAFAQWLQARRKEWSEAIDVGGLAWFQKAKLPLGAFSTLLWLRLQASDDGGQSYRLQAHAIGDTCLLHVRDGQVLRTFPVQESPEFEADPLVLGSVDLKRDHLLKFAAIDEPCRCGDLLVLCTDAVAEWGLRQSESGSTPDWASCWDLTEVQWCEQIEALRQQGEMRYDDATLVLLRVGGKEETLQRQADELVEPQSSAVVGQQMDDMLGRQLHCRPEEAESGGGSTTATPTSSTTANPTAPAVGQVANLPGKGQVGNLPHDSIGKLPDEPAVTPALVDESPSEPNAAAPILVEQGDSKEKVKAFFAQVSKGIDQVSDQVLRTAKTVADKAAEVYRDQFGPKKKRKK